ncbi:MAG: beta-glucosidase [Candidatus Sumerlaeia bacterium]|nr:beta-glucosidase [Candidatus Sumerlaeia bacterium]
MRYAFPEGFLWGAATAAYQIEGAVDQDGRSPANWDVFSRQPGRIYNGESGMRACNHYNLYKEDVSLMEGIGLHAYRFSIAWSRIIPDGKGAVNPKGLDFYSRLVDELLAKGIKPVATCYHWDMPATLEKKYTGWKSREMCDIFAEYCAVLVKALGDRVEMWSTINEPEVILSAGYKSGVHPPGLKVELKEYRQVSHNLMLAHGRALSAMRAAAPRPLKIGIVHNSASVSPTMETEGDIDAARHEFHRLNSWLLEPLVKGRYAEDLWNEAGNDVPEIQDGDMECIGAPTDFLGINTYFSGLSVSAKHGAREFEKWYPRTMVDWPVTPDTLYWTMRFVHELYEPGDLYITENGCAYPDQVKEVNGTPIVEDFARINYLREYLKGLCRATQDGIPVKGYFVWSLLDNFEWAGGYQYRFGITHVNYETFTRTPKESSKFYSRVIQNNGIE